MAVEHFREKSGISTWGILKRWRIPRDLEHSAHYKVTTLSEVCKTRECPPSSSM